MHKNEWAYPLICIVVLIGATSIVSMAIDHQKYNPSTKEFKLRNH